MVNIDWLPLSLTNRLVSRAQNVLRSISFTLNTELLPTERAVHSVYLFDKVYARQ